MAVILIFGLSCRRKYVTAPVGDPYCAAIGRSILGGYGLEQQAVGRSAAYETVSIVASFWRRFGTVTYINSFLTMPGILNTQQ
jgi:hypothetical protein